MRCSGRDTDGRLVLKTQFHPLEILSSDRVTLVGIAQDPEKINLDSDCSDAATAVPPLSYRASPMWRRRQEGRRRLASFLLDLRSLARDLRRRREEETGQHVMMK